MQNRSSLQTPYRVQGRFSGQPAEQGSPWMWARTGEAGSFKLDNPGGGYGVSGRIRIEKGPSHVVSCVAGL